MTRHMLLQYPLLALAGFLFAAALPGRRLARLTLWNAHGISGLFAAALMLAILMIPRVLDLALVDGRIEALKYLALLACGTLTACVSRRLYVAFVFICAICAICAIFG